MVILWSANQKTVFSDIDQSETSIYLVSPRLHNLHDRDLGEQGGVGGGEAVVAHCQLRVLVIEAVQLAKVKAEQPVKLKGPTRKWGSFALLDIVDLKGKKALRRTCQTAVTAGLTGLRHLKAIGSLKLLFRHLQSLHPAISKLLLKYCSKEGNTLKL